jgi:hypothetical protein
MNELIERGLCVVCYGETKSGPCGPARGGNRESLTLTPSINWRGVLHGYLRAGQLVSA